jgi:hypothetical protein
MRAIQRLLETASLIEVVHRDAGKVKKPGRVEDKPKPPTSTLAIRNVEARCATAMARTLADATHLPRALSDTDNAVPLLGDDLVNMIRELLYCKLDLWNETDVHYA